jgi:hypothetical protein
MPRNGLTREALTDPGMAAILDVMANHPLNDPRDPAFTMVLNNELTSTNGPHVTSLVEYIVSCALDRDTALHVTLADETEVAWTGEVGLCGAHSPFGDWGAGAPQQACLESVSSCVLARVNALHQKVIISARGTNSCLLPLQPRVPVETEYRECGGTAIRSFQPCAGASTDPAARDCGWSGKYVGSCTPGTTVTLRTGPGEEVRVCKGLYGCDSADSPAPATSACSSSGGYPEGTPWYAGRIHPLHIDTTEHRVTFTCPRNGLPSGPAYFAVMMASPDPSVDLADTADVLIEGPVGKYPATEQEVFTFREGAFFGNLFKTAQRTPNQASPGQLLIGDQYACYSDIWISGTSYFSDRLCAGRSTEPSCFENAPKPCLWASGSPGTPALDHRCNAESCGDEQSYLGCGWNATWDHSITVFLSHPCDRAPDLASCSDAYPAFSPQNL